MKKLLLLFIFLITNCVVNAQWTSQATAFTNVSEGVQNISIVDANTVWALGYDGTAASANYQEFTKTINGGTTWTRGTIDIGNTEYGINDIVPINATTAWISAVSPTVGLGGVWKTTDGGTSWIQQNDTAYTDPASFMNTVWFFNETTGITAGDPITGAIDFEVYRTTDGGDTWSPITTTIPNIASGEFGYNGGNVSAGNNTFWFVTNKGKMYRTSDQGATWTKLNGPSGLTDFGGVTVTTSAGQLFFSDALSAGPGSNYGICIARAGAAASPTYKLHKTTNGGTTWDAGVAYTQPYRSLAFIKGTSTLVGTGLLGTVYSSAYSNDYGTTWTLIDSGTQRTGVSFLNGTTGWAGGFTTSPTAGGIFKYTGPSLGINTIDSKLKLSATPNPTSGLLQIATSNDFISDVTVFDLLGKQVYNSKFSALNEVIVDLSSLQIGAYIVKATSDTGISQTLKIMKK